MAPLAGLGRARGASCASGCASGVGRMCWRSGPVLTGIPGTVLVPRAPSRGLRIDAGDFGSICNLAEHGSEYITGIRTRAIKPRGPV